MPTVIQPTSVCRNILLCSALGLSSLVMTQCAKPQTVHNARGVPVATVQGNVTSQRLGDTTIMTRTLISHALTNADCGKVYQEVTVVSPRGTSVQERVIVRALPRLETKNITKR